MNEREEMNHIFESAVKMLDIQNEFTKAKLKIYFHVYATQYAAECLKEVKGET